MIKILWRVFMKVYCVQRIRYRFTIKIKTARVTEKTFCTLVFNPILTLEIYH